MSSSVRLLYNSTLRLEKWGILCRRYNSTETVTKKEDEIDLTSIEETPKYEKILAEPDVNEILIKRNKSRLSRQDQNVIHNLPPYNNEDLTWFHETIRYKRRQFGRYGMKGLNVTPGILWPTEEEIDDRNEYDRIANPYTIQEGWKIIAKRNHENAEKIRLREEEIGRKMAKVGQWEKEFRAKIAKKEADLLAAKERRERMIEDVRRQFGFKIDPRDDRFKLALEQKEKEDKKRKKLEKQQERNAKYMAEIIAQSKVAEPEGTENNTTNDGKE